MADRFGPPRMYPRSIPWPPPPLRREFRNMPSTISLPTRSNATSFEPDDVREHAVMLADSESGAGVGMDDTFDTENKARTRGKKMADEVEKRFGKRPRVHVVPEGAGAEKVYRPALSLASSTDGEVIGGAIDTEDEAAEQAAKAAKDEADAKPKAGAKAA